MEKPPKAVEPTVSNGPPDMTYRLLIVLGDEVVAALLGVSTGQSGRWATGHLRSSARSRLTAAIHCPATWMRVVLLPPCSFN
jgi:hypothetical protein